MAVLVGHTADDRAETVLLRIVRGTGTKGLGGMAPDATIDGLRILRPLLGLRRSAVRGHARAVGLPTALDPTNADPAQPRARARALLPQLDGLAGGPRDAVTTILRLADLAAADAAALDDLALKVLRAARRWGPAVALPSRRAGTAARGRRPRGAGSDRGGRRGPADGRCGVRRPRAGAGWRAHLAGRVCARLAAGGWPCGGSGRRSPAPGLPGSGGERAAVDALHRRIATGG